MNERDLFVAALQIDDVAQRAAFLGEACRGQAELRQRVEALLDAFAKAGSFLQAQASAPSAGANGGPVETTLDPNAVEPPTTAAVPEVPGATIGRYKLVEPIGEGGMGSVWMAEQTEPVRRLVAVKLIKAGLDSQQVLARFEAERQALALMDHPNIAKVLDAGTTYSSPPSGGGVKGCGQPYFVMELVKGVPITRFCDERRLGLRERLELFVPVCQAIQHAHQKGIIHRDVKPSNVLVALYDDRPVPKVIDFGVAKAMGQQLTEHTLHTGFGTVVGTLEYVSPEQASFNQLDVDTRSDVYSLGVLLYELLVGSPPFTRKELAKAGVLEMLRLIREQEPVKPSTRLSSSEALPALSARRGTEPAKLSKLLRGELDWMILKALEKDRSRRYETASAFALDVQRYLADDPVAAGPPSRAYRVRKFVRRHRGSVLAATLLALALLGGIAGTSYGMVQAQAAWRAEADQRRKVEDERDQKETARQEAVLQKATAERERTIALKRLGQIENVNEILASIFRNLDPRLEAKGGLPLAAQIGERLEQASTMLDAEAVGDPLVVARLQRTLGKSQLHLGYSERAIPLLTKALATFESTLGPEDGETLHVAGLLGLAHRGGGDWRKGLGLLEETQAKTLRGLGPEHVETLAQTNNLALAYLEHGRPGDALPLFSRLLEATRAKLGPDHPDTLNVMTNLAGAYQAARRLPQATELFEEVLRRSREALGENHPDTLSSMNNLAFAYQLARRWDMAIPLFEDTLEKRRAKLGPTHPHTLSSLANLAHAYQQSGQAERALPLSLEALAQRRAKLGPDHPDTVASINNLAGVYGDLGKFNLAAQLFEEALAKRRTGLGTDHPDTLVAMRNLAFALHRAKRFVEAEAAWLEFFRHRKPGEAADVSGLGILADCQIALKKFAAAEATLRDLRAAAAEVQPDAFQRLVRFDAESRLSAALAGQGKFLEAEALALSGYQGLKAMEAELPEKVRRTIVVQALERLVQTYEQWNKPDEAARWRTLLEEKE